MIFSLTHHPCVRGSMLRFVDSAFCFKMVDKSVDLAVVGRSVGLSIDDDDDVSGIPKVIAPFPSIISDFPNATNGSSFSCSFIFFLSIESDNFDSDDVFKDSLSVVFAIALFRGALHGKNGPRKAIAVAVMEVDETLMKTRRCR